MLFIHPSQVNEYSEAKQTRDSRRLAEHTVFAEGPTLFGQSQAPVDHLWTLWAWHSDRQRAKGLQLWILLLDYLRMIKISQRCRLFLFPLYYFDYFAPFSPTCVITSCFRNGKIDPPQHIQAFHPNNHHFHFHIFSSSQSFFSQFLSFSVSFPRMFR